MMSAPSGLASFLSPSELSRLDRLALLARGRGVGRVGSHASPLPGHGVAFVDRRRYEPGDDPRAIDWRLLGRSDRLYVRRCEREADMGVALLIDDSASMDFRGLTPRESERSKHEHALRLAAAIGYLALRRRDRVVVAAEHGGRIMRAANPSRLADILRQRRCEDGAAALAGTIADVAACLDRHMTLVVLSDLLNPIELTRRAVAWAVGRGLNVVLWQVLHDDEWRLPADAPAGVRRIIDPECGEAPCANPRSEVRADLRALRGVYAKRIDRFLAAWSRAARDSGAVYGLYRSSDDLMDRLSAWLRVPAIGRAAAARGYGVIRP